MAKQTIDGVMEDYKDCQRCEDKSCLSVVSNCPKDGSIVTREAELMRAVLKIMNLDRLEEICTAEKDGRCVVLPCKVGDILYFVDKVNGEEGIFARCITEISCNDWDGIFKIKVGLWGKYDFSDIGKTVFLTREEAEAALAKEGNDERD